MNANPYAVIAAVGCAGLLCLMSISAVILVLWLVRRNRSGGGAASSGAAPTDEGSPARAEPGPVD